MRGSRHNNFGRLSGVIHRTRDSFSRMINARKEFPESSSIVAHNFYDEGAQGQAVKGVQTEEFWMNPPYGRPRNIDYVTLKQFEKSEWVQICTESIIDGVAGAAWCIVPRDDSEIVLEGSQLAKEIKHMTDWIKSFPSENSFERTISAMLPDYLWYDAGAIIKTFPLSAYGPDGEILDPSAVIDLSALDGRSIMIESGVIGGRRRKYWQYSWLTPGAIPTSFELDELMYFSSRPSSRGVYGTSKLEVIANILNYLDDAIMSNSKYLENGLFAGAQIDHPNIKDENLLVKLSKMYKAQLRGPEKAGKFIVTMGNTKVTQFPFNNEQMQWLDGQKWFAKMVMATFKVSPSELGFTEDLNRATGIQQMNIHKSKAIRPVLNMIERILNRELIWKINPRLSFKYPSSLDLDDKMKQAQIDKIYTELGIYTINDIRQREGLTEFEDDKYNEPFASGRASEGGSDEGLEFDPFSDQTLEEYLDENDDIQPEEMVTEKAIRAGAQSGEAGYATIPKVVDGHIKTEKLEQEGTEELSEFYRELREEVLKQLEEIYGKAS